MKVRVKNSGEKPRKLVTLRGYVARRHRVHAHPTASCLSMLWSYCFCLIGKRECAAWSPEKEPCPSRHCLSFCCTTFYCDATGCGAIILLCQSHNILGRFLLFYTYVYSIHIMCEPQNSSRKAFTNSNHLCHLTQNEKLLIQISTYIRYPAAAKTFFHRCYIKMGFTSTPPSTFGKLQGLSETTTVPRGPYRTTL